MGKEPRVGGKSAVQRIVKLSTVGLLAGGLTLLVNPDTAHAGGYTAARYGSAMGTPAMGNNYALYFNPAALGGAKGTQLTLDATLAWRYASYERPESALAPSNPDLKNDPSYVKANSGKASLLNFITAPFVAVSSDFGTDSFHAGYAFYAPFGGQAKWSQNNAFKGTGAYEAALDGPQRWHNISGVIRALYNTVGFAYTIKPIRLTIGVSGSLIIHQVETVRSRNSDGTDDVLTSTGALKEGRSWVKASGLNAGASVGLYYEPLEDRSLRFGVSYTSQPGFGETRMKGKLGLQTGGAKGRTDDVDVDFIQSYPDLVRFGVAHRASKVIDWRADFLYERWSVFKNQCIVQPGNTCKINPDGSAVEGADNNVILHIPRDYHDSFGVRGSISYIPYEELEVFWAASYGAPAVPKSTVDVSTIDGHVIGWSFGAMVKPSQRIGVGMSYNHAYMMQVDTGGANAANPYKKAPSLSPSSDGVYNQQIVFFNTNFNVYF